MSIYHLGEVDALRLTWHISLLGTNLPQIFRKGTTEMVVQIICCFDNNILMATFSSNGFGANCRLYCPTLFVGSYRQNNIDIQYVCIFVVIRNRKSDSKTADAWKRELARLCNLRSVDSVHHVGSISAMPTSLYV